MTSVHYQKGLKNSVAFVFSCPGSKEEKVGHPAAGATGTILDKILFFLSHHVNRKDLTRDNITITNAWKKVEYKNSTNRSEATDDEIKTPENIDRLGRELYHINELIVFCGEKAKIAYEELKRSDRLPKNVDFRFIEHISVRGLNSNSTDIDGNPIISAEKQISSGRTDAKKKKIQAENTDKRLKVVVNSIAENLVKEA